MIDISHLDKAEVLAALYNASRPLGMGFMQFDPKPMTVEEAGELLKETQYFDYLKGRVMKVGISGPTMDPWGYDRDNGEGAAQKAITALAIGGPNAPTIEHAHQDGLRASATDVKSRLNQKTTIKVCDGIAVVSLGLSDVASHLGPAINAALKNENQ